MSFAPADVTVVISAYNAAAYIGTALGSVAAQRVPPGAVVVVDDGSADDTVAVASAWADVLPVEVVALGENRGAGHARAVGVERARTALIAILDSDDYWLPDHLDTMLDTYARAGGLVTAQELWWVDGLGIGPTDERWRTVPPERDQLRGIIDHCFVSIGTLFSRDDCMRAGNFRAIGNEDWDLWIRMIRRGARVTRGPHPTFLYQIRASSVSFGTKAFDWNMDVLERAIEEAESPAERRWAEESMRRKQAQRSLAASYELARAGRAMAARGAALKALHGNAHTAQRAAFMVMFPGLGERLHERLLHDLSRRVTR
ncbi:MAG TPA: glycosyltransferase family 2 protein [Acidimicrobiia bacterium]|nr:glycosyltransferase family 2 protein [Acidimicrobiia bacterium]